MPIVVVGHVDHGKSTIVGRILADSGSLPDGKLEQVRELCARTSKPFEYAFLLDALKDERAQGITIDSARVFFKSASRHYVIIDAPGHVEFLKNMITGAARAEAALLVVDAREGVQENSRRHATMLSMLGIRHVAVLVNKMDLVGWSHDAFDAIVAEMSAFLARVDVASAAFVPVSGREGVNLVTRGADTPWYDGPTVLEVLDGFAEPAASTALPFRMPVQDVYRFTKFGDDRRIVAGTVETGTLRPGEHVVFYPSGKRTRVRAIEAFNRPPRERAEAGEAVGFTLEEQVYAVRGELAALAADAPPLVSTRMRVSLFWLGRSALVEQKDYVLRLGTARVPMRVERIEQVLDASDLAGGARARVERNEIAECVLKLKRAIAFDLRADLPQTGRFVIIDGYEIQGGGIVRESLPDREDWARSKVLLRNQKWESSLVAPERRAQRFSQRPMLLFVTGDRDIDRKGLAKELEAHLFAAGRNVYFVGMANMLYGVDADIDRTSTNRAEHFRRLGELAHLMLDAGVLLIVSAAELTQDDLEIVKVSVPAERIATIWLGPSVTTDIACDLLVTPTAEQNAIDVVETMLQDRGVIFRPW
ncbi:MAG: GTP-binding protein [Vicinamibacterales bacterium]